MNNKKTVCAYFLLAALLFYNSAAAQKVVAERDEPHHKVVFENEYIRLVEGHVPDHDTTLAHIHSANSVVVFLSKSTLGIQLTGEKPVVTEVSPGDMVYRAYGDKPITHIVWNQSKPVLHFIVVEMTKKMGGNDTCATLSQPGTTFQWQQPLVKTYYMDIAKDGHYSLPESSCAYLLIDVSGRVNVSGRGKAVSPGRMRSLQADDFVYFPPHSGIEINGGDNENTRCVLLQLND